ncbi:MAG: MOSC domain-containing protein [Halioglobus sp.]|nr:MOSC domain-containing protein [Halioglobus sp.]
MTKRATPLDRFARDIAPGTLKWIGIRTERRAPMTQLSRVEALAGLGLAGDHRVSGKPGSGRQVTLISQEFIAQIQHFTGHKQIDPGLLRRNLVVSGINLNALRYQRFAIGEALFEAAALCHPCSRMETALGKGGVAAMLGHGGLCCRVLRSGWIAVQDRVSVHTQDTQQELFD